MEETNLCMKIEKLIFLDFDGVITNYESGFRLNVEKLRLLGQIIDATDCGFVISSTWRCDDLQTTIEELSNNAKLKSYNGGIVFPYCNRIIGVTEKIPLAKRGEEIAKWINDNNFTGKYVILDDMDETLDEQKPYFVMTDLWEGLSERDVEKAIKILQ
jgi:hydroxymethylpyrimidine pyrophosphatase-like HAD family hydrolase